MILLPNHFQVINYLRFLLSLVFSMDIRKFFPVTNGSSASAQTKAKKRSVAAQPKSKMNTRKRPLVWSDSDSDEDPLPPAKTLKRKPVVSDDDEVLVLEKKTPNKQQKKNELQIETLRRSPRKHNLVTPSSKEKKEVNASNFFGKTPVDRSLKRLVQKKTVPVIAENKTKNTQSELDEFTIEDDEDFEKTLAQLDIPSSTGSLSNLIVSTSRSSSQNDIQIVGQDSEKLNGTGNKSNKTTTPSKNIEASPKRAIATEDEAKGKNKENPINKKAEEKPPKDKELNKNLHQDSDSLKTPENKKKEHYMNYQNYLHRDGPSALGSKEIPVGAEGCFEGKSFLVTGVLESIEREEVKELVQKYGGKCMSTLSKNTSFLIVGREAGPAKLEKAEKLKIKCLNEDEFLDLIRNSPCGKRASRNNQKLNAPSPSTLSKLEDLKHEPKRSKLEDECVTSTTKNFEKLISKSPENKTETLLHKSSKPKKVDSLMWVDKHKPQTLKQIIGQQGDRSNAKKLVEWLKSWHKTRGSSGIKKAPPRWGGALDDGSFFKAALLSGSPGVGKTTTAQLVCKELGFSFFELNASDTRSKRSLKEEVSQLLQNTTLNGLSGLNSTKHVIIMDEVDGMSGNEDRGGTQELIALIKTTRIPIICICNDRAHPKIRSLSNHCFDLRFQKPRQEQIKAAVLSISYKEGIKIPSDILNDIIVGSCQDVRQVLHNVFLWSVKSNCDIGEEKRQMHGQAKDIKLGPFDVLKKVFASDEEKSNIHQKSSLFFHDYSLSPLFVQENYIHVQPKNAKGSKLQHLKLLSEAADSIRDGDTVDKVIRSSNNWSLLPTQAIFSSVIPGDTMRGYLSKMINFPSWLGKNSTKNHMDRVLQQLQMHMNLRISGNKTELNMQYMPLLHRKVTDPLVVKETEGVKEVIDTMEHYFLLKDDLESISELALWSGKTDPMTKVNPKVKGALTRTFNKESFLIPYSMNVVKKGKKSGSNDLGDMEEDDGNLATSENEESDNDINSDAMVKQKKTSKASASKNIKEPNEPSTSKGKGKGKKSNPETKRGRKK